MKESTGRLILAVLLLLAGQGAQGIVSAVAGVALSGMAAIWAIVAMFNEQP